MKIHAFASLSHEPLISLWQESAKVDPDIESIIHRLGIRSNGDYANAEWKDILKACFESTLDVFMQNEGNIIGITGVDVVFLKPFVNEIRALMDGFDILMQRERYDDTIFNPDASFWRCSPKLIEGWKRWMELSTSWDGHLPQENELMRQAFEGLKIGFLPVRYANTDNGGLSKDAVLFHANVTPPPDSVWKKLQKLTAARLLFGNFIP